MIFSLKNTINDNDRNSVLFRFLILKGDVEIRQMEQEHQTSAHQMDTLRQDLLSYSWQ